MAPPTQAELGQLGKIFFPHATDQQERVAAKGTRFVHYTSAEAARSMIKHGEVWLRQPTCMKDYSEVQHGLSCLSAAYKHSEPGKKMQALLDRLFPDLRAKLEREFDQHAQNFSSGTYLVCVSEHDDREDETGRLSMWRAYSRGTGVAIVLKSEPFFGTSDALKAYFSPVAYLDDNEFAVELSRVVANLERESAFVGRFEERLVQTYLFNAFRYAALCTKHPGFSEEREWRVIYAPHLYSSQHMIKDDQVIEGVPQLIYKLPLRDIPQEGLTGIGVAALVDRVIIGPTEYPMPMWGAFVDLLGSAGMAEPWKRVVCSNIPLRT
ncbi:MAG TPA: DUF2971 domain-containing protein [Alphaproteobacteria bacterium]